MNHTQRAMAICPSWLISIAGINDLGHLDACGGTYFNGYALTILSQ
nr:hypothetical protein [Polynucleobacter cosmopolitanus]